MEKMLFLDLLFLKYYDQDNTLHTYAIHAHKLEFGNIYYDVIEKKVIIPSRVFGKHHDSPWDCMSREEKIKYGIEIPMDVVEMLLKRYQIAGALLIEDTAAKRKKARCK